MSRQLTAMQYVLDLLTDGIYTTTTQNIGIIPHDEVTEDRLPLVMAFSPEAATADDDPRIMPGSFVFVVQIIDVKGKTDALQEAVDSLERALRSDSSMKGLVRSTRVEASIAAEVGKLDRSVAAATVTVDFPDVMLVEDADVELLKFDSISNYIKVGADLLQAGTLGGGSIGFKKGQLVSNPSVNSSSIFNPADMPFNLAGVKVVRLFVYQDRENSHDTVTPRELSNFGFKIKLFSSGPDSSEFLPKQTMRHGWNEVLFDLEDPTSELGTLDLSNIIQINFIMNYSLSASLTSSTFGIVFRRFGYTPRDIGDNNGRGVHPGF